MYQQKPEATGRKPVENVDVSTKSSSSSTKMILLIHQHFPLAFLILLQVFVETSTLSYLVKLEVEFVDTSTFSTATYAV